MKIDADEKELLESVERGDWQSAGAGRRERTRNARYAKARAFWSLGSSFSNHRIRTSYLSSASTSRYSSLSVHIRDTHSERSALEVGRVKKGGRTCSLSGYLH
jgi:hypothetical protein